MRSNSIKLLLSIMFSFILITHVYCIEEKNSMSIFDYINKNMGKDGKFPEDKDNLDFNNKAEYKIRIKAGNQDGYYRYHCNPQNSNEIVEKIGELIKKISIDNKNGDKEKLYELIRETRVITWIDEIIIYCRDIEINKNLENLAEDAAFHSDEIEIVKFGMFLKGVVGDKESKKR